ncbi:LamG domain-containing protein [Actinosynnema pretiosum subsp. pretiosum]|uniref:LamG domain-containing protein n=1 Tax=Actinosynnema pretiosum subsp. pretiosum TaxID=103721 RepID=A0AA45L7Q4_9PSEU|nr:Beta-galactosidase [Actinosynnema pretiosum subsp. pretiosum]QUF04700.1 LamG domain-containing protein [Actinosynnema pretiosum subsp. pretiosum]
MRSRAHARGFALRFFATGTALAALAGGVVAPPAAVAAPAKQPVPTEAADEATAGRYAATSGKSVLVTSATTETDELKANPDGTMTLTQHVQPVRVKRGSGWTPVDLTLERRGDGTLRPKAAPVQVAFSAGGEGSVGKPIAKVAESLHEVGIGWTRDLPAPVLDGSTATYREVLPGVDLKVEAELSGFSQVLVVKDREAAKNPELGKIAFRTHTGSVRVEEGQVDGEGLIARNGNGTPVFSGDASRMWDSSSRAADNQTGGPQEGDRLAEMGVEVGKDTVAISPDQDFLQDPKTVYPVLLDPEYSCTNCGKTHHNVVQSPPEWANAHNYDATGGQMNDLKAGYLNRSSLQASTNGISRTYLQMNTTPIHGKYVASATLRTKVVNSYACGTASPTQMWLVGWMDWNTTWNNQPQWYRLLSENNRTNNPGYCPSDGGADFDVTSAVREASDARWGSTAFMLKAKNENDLNNSWRRFDLNPYLEVRYNSYPNAPVDLGMESWGGGSTDALPCVTGANRPVLATKTPRLRARLTDPDGGILDGGFRLYKGPASGYTWNGSEFYTTDVPSGSFGQAAVPGGWISSEGVHSWQVWGGDRQFHTWSQVCEFDVDTVAPNTPAVSSSDYPATGLNGMVGRTGTFTLKPNGNTGTGGAMDVVRYGWSLNDDTATRFSAPVSAADGTVTVQVTPTLAGTNTLHVTAFDRAGNRAAANAVYRFGAAEPTGVKAAWTLNETSGNTSADVSGNRRPLTLAGGAAFGPGYSDNGMVGGGYATTAGPVVDTTRAFSTAAWVRLDRKDNYYTALSQDGANLSGFYLQYSKDVDRWSVSASAADDVNSPAVRASSSAAPQLGVWTHLTATYEPNSRQLTLYVDGKPQGSATATLWPANGSFVVGGAKWGGQRVDLLPGAVDQVQVWDRVISPAEAASTANSAVLRARYRLDEQNGTTTRDSVAGTLGTLSGNVTWGGVEADPDDPNQVLGSEEKWLTYDASWTGQVEAAKPALVRTDRSYTVSGWARMPSLDQANRAVIAFGDAKFSPFMLSYRGDLRKWGFLVTKSPAGDGWFALSDNQVAEGEWTHLTAVYDAVTGQISLYVNGEKQKSYLNMSTTDGTGVTGWEGSGPLWIGRAVWTGQKSDVWKGDLDDIRVYTGVLTPTQVRAIHADTWHG